jgi:copper chaperone CopZ
MIKKFSVNGMSCAHCVMAVEKQLNKIDIDSVRVEIGTVEVEYDPEKINDEMILLAIEEAGYKVIRSEKENR